MTEKLMNEFSVICRVLGSLFYRQPQDPLLVPLFGLIREGKLQQQWPLEQNDLLRRLQQQCEPKALTADYNALFIGSECQVPPYGSLWENGPDEGKIRLFLQQYNMPVMDSPADHFGALLLASSWLEDHTEQNVEAQLTLFELGILPWSDTFLGKVEAFATTSFYRTLAAISREAIQAMYDELHEESQSGSTSGFTETDIQISKN